MNTKMKKIKNQKGQGILEYVILTGLIGIFCLGMVKNFGDSLNNKIKGMKEKINQQVIIK